MYTFFTIFGFLFISVASILIDYIYTAFSINKFTSFFYPIDGRTVLNEINITVLPIIVWAFVELPILANNPNFLIAIILNIIVSSAIIYEVKYGLLLINKRQKIIDVFAIISATLLGQTVSYMIFKSPALINSFDYSYIISIVGIVLLFIIHALITLRLPQIKKKKVYKDKR